MRGIGYFLLTLLMTLLTACGEQEPAMNNRAPVELVAAIQESQSGLPALRVLTPEAEEFTLYLTGYYQIDETQLEDGIICYAEGVEASEIAVLLFSDEEAAQTAGETLEVYRAARAGDFVGYAPQQAELVENGLTVVSGQYAALMICPDPEAAQAAFLAGDIPTESGSGLTGSRPEEESGTSSVTEDAYDPEAVLAAWHSGEAESLSEMNRAILDAASETIAQEIAEDMSGYEKELAIHDWMTGWSSFDMNVFSHAPEARAEADNRNPYGFLVNRSAMCHGYSSTFQLFMDMLDIECITVYGTPNGSGTEHSWNMVCLDGEWYCVDVAWDDPIGGSPGHTYFNVTSERLRQGSIHRWDETQIPEATGTAYAYGK